MADGTTNADRVFGIDLGTTYSAIAYIDETGRPTVCRNDANSEITPSVVHFETPDNVVVGETAKQSAFIDAENVVKLIKRRMGEEIELEFHGRPYTPESISALILKRLAADAASHSNGPVEHAVITVPAYFGVRQKEATQKAGMIAGLDVVGVLPEPVAAAVHYDLTGGGANKTVLVYDLGGGTFDTTVIDVSATEITVLCTDGDTNLGGADWDARLSEHVMARFAEHAQPDESPDDDDEFLQEVAIKVEELKKQLTAQESRSVQLRFAGSAAKIEVTRAEFESLTADLVDRTVDIVKRTLDTLEDQAKGATVDEVLLVGGSTKMPMIMNRLSEEFGWSPKLHDPDLAVAKGAALWGLSRIVYRQQQEARNRAATPEEGELAAAEVVEEAARQYGLPARTVGELTGKRTHSVLPKAFGVRVCDDDGRDFVKHLVFANEQLPITDRHLPARTHHHQQTEVRIEIFEQAGAVAGDELSENNPLSHDAALIRNIPPQPVGRNAEIDIRLAVDEDGLLRVRATELVTNQELEIEVRISLTEAEVGDAVEAISAISVSS